MFTPGERDLAVVSALGQGRSLSAAARLLGVAHTTVARRLADLEHYYGAELFFRGSEGMVPTTAGEALLAAASRARAELQEAERRIKGRDLRLEGRVSLSTVDLLAERYMPRLAALRQSYPGIDLALEISPELRNLSRREAEIGLRLTNAPEPHLFGRQLETLHFCAYARADLGAEPDFISYGERDCAAPANRWLRANIAPERLRAQVPTPGVMLRAVAAGLGAGLLPREIAGQDPTLRCLDVEPAFTMGVWVLTAPELKETARVRAVLEVLGQRSAKAA
ncbi:LysR family transcriptional regulator [Pseudoruegeria sp. SHC-113]|uniref:LysR family transcriptional regulator n=1 Tax=Pseudoruegeria sp. SHC-113 TaxID=2855439 RepID=UPI0021BBA509|nr:LysR family transcriptional regulator [Pseudoruegeria sp. SHC-113]MCT8161424.1 LysR family transcriptional regulator [Pseudoruegeria sp. SHC-113]